MNKSGEKISASIDSIAYGGRGVARINGKVCFIPFTAPGDTIEAEIIKDNGKYSEGRLIRILEPSPDRREPLCGLFSRCGGCSLQHINYPRQLLEKEGIVSDTLHRLGKTETDISPIIPSPMEYGYRNRTRIRHSTTGIYGYYREGSREIVPVKECPILEAPLNTALTNLWNSNSIIPARRRELELYLDAGGKVRERRIFENKEEGEYGFSQINNGVNRLLKNKITETCLSHFPKPGKLLDLFCGDGNLSLPLLETGWQITGIDSSLESVSRAKILSGGRGQYFSENLYREPFLIKKYLSDSSILIMDPPRAGLKDMVYIIKTAKVPLLLYISCNPPVLARDTRILIEGGYKLKMVLPFDMFPQTSHIEVMAVFMR